MSRAGGLVALILLATIAGCMGDEAATPAATEAGDDTRPSSPLLERFDARDDPSSAPPAASGSAAEPRSTSATSPETPPGPVAPAAPSSVALPTASSWWLVPVKGTPEGGLSAFWWSVPEGAVVPDGWNEVFDRDDTTVVLEVAPVVPPGKDESVLAWGLLAFRVEDGELIPGAGDILFAGTSTTYEAGTSRTEPIVPELLPTFVQLGKNAKAGDSIAFVAVAVTAEPMEIGIALSILDHDPSTSEGSEDPTATVEDYLAARRDAPFAPHVVEASGFTAAFYVHFASMGFPAGVPYSRIQQAGHIGVTRVGPPESGLFGPFESVQTPATDAPWVLVSASYLGWGTGGSAWRASGTCHGETLAGQGAGPEAFPLVFAGQGVLDSGAIFCMGDGEGNTAVAMEVATAGVPLVTQLFAASSVTFGASLGSLFGVPSATTSGTTGDLGVWSDERGLHRTMPDGAVLSWRTKAS